MAEVKQQSSPTQQFIEVEGVHKDALILRNGGLRKILLVSGVNFDLKSEDEQNAITYAYQNFLNSLDFSLQIFIHSRKINIESYLENMGVLENKETNPLLKTQIQEYREFIRSFVSQNAIMDKNFFVVVPYEGAQLGETASGFLGGLLGGKKKKTDEKKDPAVPEVDENLERKIDQLNQRADQVIASLTQIGLRAVPLKDNELVDLFYNLYNPSSIEKRGVDKSEAGEAPLKPGL